MHIVYVIRPGGGPEAYVKTLLDWLQEHGHRISIIYTVASVEDEHSFPDRVILRYAPHGPLHYYLSRLIGNFRAWPKRLGAAERAFAVKQTLKQIDMEVSVDVVEVTEGVSLQTISQQWPIVLRAHGAGWTFRQFCEDKSQKYDHLIRQDAANNLRYADQVSAISDHLASHLSQECDFPRELIKAIPYPIDCREFSPKDARISSTEGPMLLTIGRLEHRKGTDVLVRALSSLWRKYPHLKAYFLGNESQFRQEELRALTPEPFQQRLVFPGFVSHHALPQYYRAAAVYVAPSQYETFGYTILEAMACGCPVVSCDVGAVSELVEHGVNGLLVPFGDVDALAEAILQLLNEPTRSAKMGQAGREKALAYDLDMIGPAILETYRAALSAH